MNTKDQNAITIPVCPECGGHLYEDCDGFVKCDSCEYEMSPYPSVSIFNRNNDSIA